MHLKHSGQSTQVDLFLLKPTVLSKLCNTLQMPYLCLKITSRTSFVSYHRLWSLSEYKIKVFFSKARIVKNQMKHEYISIAKDWIPPDMQFLIWLLGICKGVIILADTCQWMFWKIGSWLYLETRCLNSLKRTQLKKTCSYQMCLRFIWYY